MTNAAPPPAEGNVSVPRVRYRWLRAGARMPRGHRSPLVRMLVALTSSGALLAVAALVAAAAIVPPIGARRTARDLASREVQVQLEPGEKVVASTFASQRRWTDMWRESFGMLVATDRRVLYVGAPPSPLLRPLDEGPTELLVESYRYDAAFTIEPRERIWPLGEGLSLRTPAGDVKFIIDERDRYRHQGLPFPFPSRALAKGALSRHPLTPRAPFVMRSPHGKAPARGALSHVN